MSSSTPSVNKIIRAGAGAGKTTRLISEVQTFALEYYKNNGKYPRIILTTFTVKATQELRERFLLSAQKLENSSFEEYINSNSQLMITTLHGLFYTFLKKFVPSVKLIDAMESRRQLVLLARDLVYQPKYGELLEGYSFNQLIDMLQKLYLLNSVEECKPGTKQLWIDYRTHELNRLEEPIIEFCRILLKQIEPGPWEQYFNQLLNVLSDDHDVDLPGKPRWSNKNPVFDPDDHEALKVLLKKYLDFKDNEFYKVESFELFNKLEKLFGDLANEFAHKKSQDGSQFDVSMSELELMAFQLIKNKPSHAKDFSEQWQHWYIDEFQDTSPLQVSMLNALIGVGASFYVGDPQQSIYLFRGSDVSVFVEKENHIQSSSGVAEVLMTNYRSDANVLMGINSLVKKRGFASMEVGKAESSNNFGVSHLRVSNGEAEESTVALHIQSLIVAGYKYNEIAVLCKTNKNVLSIGKKLRDFGINVEVVSQSGFYDKIEVVDSLSVIKFLMNPFDNENLIRVLQTPWFDILDKDIVNISKKSKKASLWTALNKVELDVVDELNRLVQRAERSGVLETLKWFWKRNNIVEFSHYIDGTGRYEANLFKLYSLIETNLKNNDFDLLEFVNQALSDKPVIESMAEALPASGKDSVTVMTIHASKGLQFKQVIVPFCGKRFSFNQMDSMIVAPNSKSWSLRAPVNGKLRTSLFGYMANQERKELELEEFDRLFYVALTRAEEGLCTVTGEKIELDSWADRFTIESFGFSHVANDGKMVSESSLEKTHDFDNVKLFQKTEPEILVKSVRQRTCTLDSIRRQQFGVRFHAMMESMIDGHRDQLTNYTEDELMAIEYIFNLEDPPIAGLLKDGYKEWPYAYKDGGDISAGRVDLWGVLDGITYVVDYKTGHSGEFDQLKGYARALNHIEGKDTFRLCLVYPFSRTVSVQDFEMEPV